VIWLGIALGIVGGFMLGALGASSRWRMAEGLLAAAFGAMGVYWCGYIIGRSG